MIGSKCIHAYTTAYNTNSSINDADLNPNNNYRTQQSLTVSYATLTVATPASHII